MKKNFAVILSGCGVYDGAEIHEAVLTLLAIANNGASYKCFAPDMEQAHVINHLNGQVMPETRNVLIEAARIARGDIKPLSDFNPDDFDALVLPGGFGAAKNLSTFAFEGAECSVHDEVEMAVEAMAGAGKPIGALCIAPVILARILRNVSVTIGNDQGTAEAIEKLGGTHLNRSHGEVAVDEQMKVVTTPCYMLDATIDQIYAGAANVIKTLLQMA